MFATFQLLVPAYSIRGEETYKQNNEGRFSSALAHLATSLAVAIILGVAAALAAYFLTQGAILWMALASGTGAVVSGFVTYVILRCAFGRIPHSIPQASSEGSNTNSSNFVNSHTDSAGEAAIGETDSVPLSKRIQGNHPDVKGTVYINSLSSGPVRHDRVFEFAKRLETLDHRPVTITEDTIFLELTGEFEPTFNDESSCFRDKNGCPTCHLYLPSSLFEGIKEGGTIRFFYDGKLIELTCRQSKHPDLIAAGWTFEGFLDNVKAMVRLNHSQALWPEDIKGEPMFMGELVGQSLVQINCSDNSTTQIQDFQFFEDDQKKHGPYQKLITTGYGNTLLFNIYSGFGLKISDISLIESKGVSGLHQIWIIIPHKPEENQYPKVVAQVTNLSGDSQQVFDQYSFNPQNQYPKDVAKVTNIWGDSQRVFDQYSFNPRNGDRMAFYQYGQYSMCTLKDSMCTPDTPIKAQLSYHPLGWLQLTIAQVN